MELALLVGMVKESNLINSLVLLAYRSMMMIKLYMLFIMEIQCNRELSLLQQIGGRCAGQSK